ncbi:M20/M25/M40 family metallo-hydrolase, partial [bacterium]|nr:M20/M25/M40 family metallo-hydrolase [bacterium]
MKLDNIFNMINKEELLSEAENLIRIPSHLYTPGKEKEISKFIAGRFRNENFNVDLQEVEHSRYNVIVKMSGNRKGKSLALNGHLDIVPPGEDMVTPYNPTIKNGRLYGRGSADMKGAVGAMMYTLILLKKCRVILRGSVYFTGVIGEETGGTGTRFLVNSGFKPDFVIVGEPTNLNLVTSHKGVQQLSITIKGKAAHGDIPNKGVNA